MGKGFFEGEGGWSGWGSKSLSGLGRVAASPPARGGDEGSGDIAISEIVEALAPHDDARVAARTEDDGRPGHAVVVVGHRVTVGAGDGGDDHVTGLGIVEQSRAADDVAGLAVLAGKHAGRLAAEAIDELGCVAGVVEHGTEVVGHTPVDGNPGGDVALDRLDRIEGDAGVGGERAPGLDQEPAVLTQILAHKLADSTHVVLDGEAMLGVGLSNAKPPTQIPGGKDTKLGELL